MDPRSLVFLPASNRVAPSLLSPSLLSPPLPSPQGLCYWATRPTRPTPLSPHPPKLLTVLTFPLSFHPAWIPPKSTQRCSTHTFRIPSRLASAPPPRSSRY